MSRFTLIKMGYVLIELAIEKLNFPLLNQSVGEKIEIYFKLQSHSFTRIANFLPALECSRVFSDGGESLPYGWADEDLDLQQLNGARISSSSRLYLPQPLHRGMNVRFRKLSLTKWLKFLYEGIQNYCYHCGKLDHTFNKCDKFLHHCDHHPFPPSLSYKDALRAAAKSIYKKSIFELSNSIPFEEQPSLTNLDHHSLQDQTNRFLATTMPTTFPATVASSPSPNFIQHTTVPTSNTTYSSQPQTVHPTLHCSLPTHPIMTTTTLPTTSKGKAPMYPQPSLVSLNSPPLSSLNIIDSPAAPSSTRKSSTLTSLRPKALTLML
ncbi:hypothetical protein F8388_017496 [Cannabis sativa]|uniref:CCHC-type domain-containing protein n=1 Tax=Cannabis sativa TaxID=3483 RepID=A0A7J6G2V0_CANSA|nr:hypothetical protein F8388_017496 [Cannabis sativa]